MKNYVLTLAAIALAVFSNYAQILTFENSALAGGEATASSNSNDANISSSTLSRGSGLTAAGNAGRYNATSWATSATPGSTDYMEFTITPNAGYEFSVTSIVMNFQRSGTGPKAFAIRSSVDGYTADLATQTIADVTTTQTLTFTFSQTSSCATAITYRFYGYNAEATTGSGGIGDGGGNDLIVNGTVSACGGGCTAPTTQATSFSSSSISFNTATVSWSRGDGDNVLVIAQAGSAPGSPTSGSSYTANANYGSGDAIGSGFVVYNGAGTSVNLTGLSSGTTYHFAIFEYNNTGVCYLTPGLTGNFTTPTVSSASDIITAGGESATVSSTITTAGPLTSVQGVQVWQFTIRDGGATTDADNLPTILEDLVIDQGTGNAMNDWSVAIQSADLFDGATHLGTAVIGATDLTFTGLSATAADNGSKTLSLRISLNCGADGNGNVDGDDFQFRILAANTTAAGTGTSGFSAFSSAGSTSSNGQNVYSVAASTMVFSTQPTTTAINNAFSPSVVVSAVDACGNLDIDVTGSATITSTGTLTGGSTTNVSFSSGTATFSNLVHNALGTGLTLDATHSGALGTVTSTTFDIPTTTSFEKGDFAIVAVNTTRNSSGSADEVCFITFKSIAPGTSWEITDNGYERVTADEWGNTEGTVRFTRDVSASSIAAGSVICIEGPDNGLYSGDGLDYFDIYVCGVKDDANWTIASQTNYGVQQMDWNSNDQIWIMQGGTWNHNTDNGHDDTYTGGNILYGWTAIGWEPAAGYASTSGSTFLPEMDCYVTDVNGIANKSKVKYVGPKTGSKFQILSYLNDISNWQGYSSNANYDAAAAAYDYLNETCTNTGFTITSSSGVGTWTGSTSTDWFYCANWDDFTIPDATVNVTINQTATNDCVVASVTDTARCASISLSSNNGTNNNLEVAATGVLEVGGDITILKSAGSGSIVLSVTGDGELTADDITITGTSSSSNNAILRNESSTALLDITGDITIATGGLFDLNADGTLYLEGDFINNHNADGFSEGSSTVIFDGTTDQNINTSGFTDSFHDVTLNKASGNLILQDNISLDATGILALDDDYLMLNGNELTLNNSALAAYTRTTGAIVDESGSGTGNNSGKISWAIGAVSGDHVYPFAISSGGTYIPFTFNVTAGNAGTVSVSTYGTSANNQPWPSAPDNVTNLASTTELSPDNRDATADRFWQIDPSGTPTATLTFGYDITELPVAPYNDHTSMIAQRYDTGTNEWDETIFPGQSTGTITGGYTVTVPGITTFSPWTLSNSTSPLPAELTVFEAKKNVDQVDLFWVTESEINVSYFVIERSKNGIEFQPILSENAHGNSTSTINYQTVDYSPLQGKSFYRLQSVDFDGSYEYSQVRAVEFGEMDLNVWNDQDNWNVNYKSNSEDYLVRVYNNIGQVVRNTHIVQNPENKSIISHQNLPAGVYIMVIEDNGMHHTVKVIK